MRQNIGYDCIETVLDGKPVRLDIELTASDGIMELELLLAEGDQYECFTMKHNPATDKPEARVMVSSPSEMTETFPMRLSYVVGKHLHRLAQVPNYRPFLDELVGFALFGAPVGSKPN